LSDVGAVYAAGGVQSVAVSGVSAFGTIDYEISGRRPVEVAFAWTGGGGHVIIVRETFNAPGGPAVSVNDPWYGSGGVYYTDLLNAYGMGQGIATWIGLRV